MREGEEEGRKGLGGGGIDEAFYQGSYNNPNLDSE